MSIRWPLIRWQLQQTKLLNLIVGVAAIIYVMTRKEPFTAISTSPCWFPPLHAAVIVWFLGRANTSAAGYLHIQGFSRDTVWWHTLLSSVVCMMFAWGITALLIGTGLRSACQDLLQNPFFPYTAPVEVGFLWVWLWEYAMCLPLAFYCAGRWGHSARGNDAGLMGAALLTLLLLSSLATYRGWYSNFSFIQNFPLLLTSAVVACAALLAGRQLFCQREVQP
jgi:hypothetical protein